MTLCWIIYEHLKNLEGLLKKFNIHILPFINGQGPSSCVCPFF